VAQKQQRTLRSIALEPRDDRASPRHRLEDLRRDPFLREQVADDLRGFGFVPGWVGGVEADEVAEDFSASARACPKSGPAAKATPHSGAVRKTSNVARSRP
jgi:hypothetical protein